MCTFKTWNTRNTLDRGLHWLVWFLKFTGCVLIMKSELYIREKSTFLKFSEGTWEASRVKKVNLYKNCPKLIINLKDFFWKTLIKILACRLCIRDLYMQRSITLPSYSTLYQCPLDPNFTNNRFVEINFDTNSSKTTTPYIKRVAVDADRSTNCWSQGKKNAFVIKNQIEPRESDPNHCFFNFLKRRGKFRWPRLHSEIMIKNHPFSSIYLEWHRW